MAAVTRRTLDSFEEIGSTFSRFREEIIAIKPSGNWFPPGKNGQKAPDEEVLDTATPLMKKIWFLRLKKEAEGLMEDARALEKLFLDRAWANVRQKFPKKYFRLIGLRENGEIVKVVERDV